MKKQTDRDKINFDNATFKADINRYLCRMAEQIDYKLMWTSRDEFVVHPYTHPFFDRVAAE